MQLTLYTDYAIRTLIYLGTHPDRRITVGEISTSFGISRNHLTKVVQRLGQLGYVNTVRGKHGGLELARHAGEVTLGEMVRLLEPFTLVECFDTDRDTCPITPACKVKGALEKARQRFLSALDEYTVADMVEEPRGLITLLAIGPR
ncbi:MAG: Rrf2 family transcriptional regulator [Nitrospirota bacterium]|nr:Rrf2 family transcriptional regulator [Nitrospirota bacterium]